MTRSSIATSIATPLALGLSALVFCWVALYNGFPLFFQDTHHYLSLAIDGETYWARPVFYSYFLLPLHGTRSLWPIVFVQGLILAHLIALTIRVVTGSASPRTILGGCLVLGIFTSLPWYASWIMADVFTGVVVLGLFLLGFGDDRLSRRERAYVSVLTAAAITFHLSHVLISVACAAVTLVVRWAIGRRSTFRNAFRPILRRVILPPVAAILALTCVQIIDRGEVRVASHSEIFLLARFLADTPTVDYLEEVCPDASYRLCDHLDALPMGTQTFLWDASSPLYLLGGPDALRGEARAITLGSLRRFPFRHARRAAIETYRQLRRYETADGMSPMPEDPALTGVLGEHFPEALSSFRACRQNQGTLPVGIVRPLHGAATHLAFGCALLLLVPLVRLGMWRAIGLYGVVATGVLVNAFACGALSEAASRYQSRVIWLVVLLALVGALALWPRLWPVVRPWSRTA